MSNASLYYRGRGMNAYDYGFGELICLAVVSRLCSMLSSLQCSPVAVTAVLEHRLVFLSSSQLKSR